MADLITGYFDFMTDAVLSIGSYIIMSLLVVIAIAALLLIIAFMVFFVFKIKDYIVNNYSC